MENEQIHNENEEKIVLPKMSLKAMGCRPRAGIDDKAVSLAVIYGNADGIYTNEDRQGRIYTALQGQFEAVNLETGQEYESSMLFLPGGIHETVESAVRRDIIEPQKPGMVRFALEIRTKKAANPVGYTYQAVALYKPERTEDPLATVRDVVSKHAAKRLEAGK